MNLPKHLIFLYEAFQLQWIQHQEVLTHQQYASFLGSSFQHPQVQTASQSYFKVKTSNAKSAN